MEERPVRHVLIIANWGKEASHALSKTISEYLDAKGISNSVFPTNAENEPLEVQEGTDLVICLGGDGTVLYSARYLQDLGIPILAINLGPSDSSPRYRLMSGRRQSSSICRGRIASAGV